jgi:DNA-binding CsgD family transcriptional regulator
MIPTQLEPAARTFERRIAGSGDARLLENVLARKSPHFYIVDENLNVHLRSGDGLEMRTEPLPDDIHAAVKQLFDTQRFDSAVVPVRRDLALRVLRLHGALGTRYALFLEPYRGRDLVELAVKRFALTSREGAVLDLVLRGAPTSEIAAQLHITDGTVHEHIKNLGAKVGVTRRNEIVATVLGLAAA